MQPSQQVTLVKRSSIWSVPRSPTPPFLVAAGVPTEQWESTWDDVTSKQAEFHSLLVKRNKVLSMRAFTFVLISVLAGFCVQFSFFLTIAGYIIICFLLQIIFFKDRIELVKKECNDGIAKWLQYIEEQQQIYSRYGLHVSATRQSVSKKLIIGGLAFVTRSTSAAIPSDTSNNNTILEQLISLNNLHQSGALTHEEYSRAKQLILKMEQKGEDTSSSIELRQVSINSSPTHQSLYQSPITIAQTAITNDVESNQAIGSQTPLIAAHVVANEGCEEAIRHSNKAKEIV